MSAVWILMIIIAIAGFAIQAMLQSRFKKYSRIPLRNGMTGREVAEKMLHDNGIYDVQVISVRGQLTDHYNPVNKTINLSEPVYNSNSVAAAAVAAHETGHALQHAKGYLPLKMRSALVPVVSASSRWVTWILLIGIITVSTFPALLWVGIALFAMTTLFSFVTLPVEKNATARALRWLSSAGITDVGNHTQATDALRWAGYTYVVAALSSLATLLYYIMIALSGSRR
jgi:Zn-dependent membrane protease YugP